MLMNKLSIIVRQYHVFSIRELQEFDIGHAEQAILMFLRGSENVNQEAIASYFTLDKGAVAKTLSKLEKKEYIKRVTNLENQREKLISLDSKGREIIDYMMKMNEEWINSVFKGLSQSDIEHLEKNASIIAANAIKVVNKE
ncbi:MarR family winged helix-turn-helix transcriptional regulator [Clostridium cylindrosporum]|uniref:MarR family transcriptional regulator n=1 Tax=Clostridium cylindrosporum DSM 605 TaxID=1121307 RepID=A0A0J8FZQ1_CLOCY|nr:MarR family transcriptional regulator [Clostridium cylindrosporum]KMT21036.1 MarR family transcriptional regulator [Clostridium cylindrosporum DSM 605]